MFLPPNRSRRGTTLIELTLALAISSMLLLGMASALLVAVRSVPDPASAASVDRAAERAAQRLSQEIAEALAFPEREPASLTLVLPDRDGDALPETVRWWREDAPGAPLLRQKNQEAAEAVTGPLVAFEATFSTLDGGQTHPGVPLRGDNILLGGHEGFEKNEDFKVEHQKWYTVPLLADLPADAVAWELEDATLRLERAQQDGVLRVEIQRWAGDQPAGPGLGAVQVVGEDLPIEDEWVNLDYSSVAGNLRVPAGSHLVAVLRNSGASEDDAAVFEAAEVEPGLADGLFESTNRGESWSREKERRARHSFRGRLWSPGPGWTSPRPLAGPITLRLQASATRVATSKASPTGGAWTAGWRRLASFSVDPSRVDLDADGVGDFTPPLPSGSLQDGVLRVPNAVGVSLTGDAAGFVGPTRLQMRLRDTTVGDDGGRVEVRFGRGAGTARRVAARIWRDPDGQWLALEAPGNGDGAGEWFRVESVPGIWVEVDLVLDPAGGRVAAAVNGVWLGTLPAESATDSSSDADLTFTSEAAGVEVGELGAWGGAAP